MFAHGKRANPFARNQPRQIFAFLFFGGEAKQLVDDEIGVNAITQSHRCGGATDFFNGDDLFDKAHAGAAIIFRDGDAEQTELAQLRPEVSREIVLAVDGLRSGRDMVRRKSVHGLAQHVCGLAKRKIQGGFSFGDSPVCGPV